MFPLDTMLLNGLLLSLLLSVIVVASLAYNARLWLQDYPKAIQAVVPPKTAQEKRQTAVLGVVLMGLMFGLPLLAGAGFKQARGADVTFLEMALFLYGMLFCFNLFDAVVLDWFLMLVVKPRFVFLPGSEGMMSAYTDVRMHLKNFLLGCVFCLMAALLLAAVVMVLL